MSQDGQDDQERNTISERSIESDNESAESVALITPQQSSTDDDDDAPEKALTRFAMYLALLEKTATGLGTLGFVWATVVLLGGFAITLETSDFLIITIILVFEGARIFGRSHELEWQHQATWSDADDAIITRSSPPPPPGNSIELEAPTSCPRTRNNPDAIQQEAPSSNSCTRGNADIGTTSSSSKSIQQDKPSSSSTTRDEENQLLPVPVQQQQPMPTYTASSSITKNNIRKVWVWLKQQVSMFFQIKNICSVWYLFQLMSALTCVALSLMKLIMHNFGHVEKGDTDKRNRKTALFVFYSLVLAEATLFILEKGYWEWTNRVRKLLKNVNDEYELKSEGMVATKRFFYDAYTKSINGSVFDSLRMDMVSFAVEFLNSNSPNEQLIGATLLRKLSTNRKFSSVTLRKVDKSVIERLVEMLNWRNPNEQEIRESAAAILEQVASQTHSSSRIADIPGAMESIASLLFSVRKSYKKASDEITQRDDIKDFDDDQICQRGDIEAQDIKHVIDNRDLGLRILNKLSHDRDNCAKIGNTRGLLPNIIDFIYTTEEMYIVKKVPNWHITTARQSLKLVTRLASSTGVTGDNLRKELSEILFTIIHIRNILKFGNEYPKFQLRGIKVLTKLGLEDDATEKIGGTGGVLNELLNIFYAGAKSPIRQKLRNAAGGAIAMLTLESKNNCHRVLHISTIEELVNALENESLCINAARILMNLCIYSDEHVYNKLRKLVETAPIVLNAIMQIKPVSPKRRELMIGLALPVFKYMTYLEFKRMLQNEGHCEYDLAAALVNILKDHHRTPYIQVPRIRRFVIELAMWMMNESIESLHKFRELKIAEELIQVFKTATDIENFHIFTGTVGVSRYDKSLLTLAHEALSLVAKSQKKNNH